MKETSKLKILILARRFRSNQSEADEHDFVYNKKTLESFDSGIQNSFRTQMILTLIRRLDSMYEKYRDVID